MIWIYLTGMYLLTSGQKTGALTFYWEKKSIDGYAMYVQHIHQRSFQWAANRYGLFFNKGPCYFFSFSKQDHLVITWGELLHRQTDCINSCFYHDRGLVYGFT
jgi:hypothetical protein